MSRGCWAPRFLACAVALVVAATAAPALTIKMGTLSPTGSPWDDALKQALRKALEQGAGLEISAHSKVDNFVLIRDKTEIGRGCTIGSYVDIEGEVSIGNFVSLQSACYITRGVIIEDEVFCGPRIVTMNDKRMVYRRANLVFERSAPRILRGARVGGGSVLLPGVTVGRNALVGAGSVVTNSV